MPVVAWIVAAVAIAAVGAALGRWAAVRRAQAFAAGVRAVSEAIAGAAGAERTEALRAAEIEGRNEARAPGAAADSFCQVREAELEGRVRRFDERRAALAALEARLAEARGRVAGGEARLAAHRAEADRQRREAEAIGRSARAALERAAGEDVGAITGAIREAEIDDARLAAARVLRGAAELAHDGAARPGKRLIGI